MRTDPTPEPGDRDRRPFSNGTEGEMWTAGMCGSGAGTGEPCVHDSAYGGADDEEGDVFCPLISLSLNGVWPHEWAVEQVPWTDSAGVTHTYDRPGVCSEYADELPPAAEPPVVAVDLFGVYAAEPRRAGC